MEYQVTLDENDLLESIANRYDVDSDAVRFMVQEGDRGSMGPRVTVVITSSAPIRDGYTRP